jgi:hypothetical protein
MGRRPKFKPSQPPPPGAKIAPHDAPSEGSTNHVRPIFNLEHLKGRYCLSECTTDEKAAFADALHTRSKMTWAELRLAARHGLGFEIIPRQILRVQDFPSELTEDRQLLAFRFCGKAPMVGYRTGREFTVLFLDRDFTLYPHE